MNLKHEFSFHLSIALFEAIPMCKTSSNTECFVVALLPGFTSPKPIGSPKSCYMIIEAITLGRISVCSSSVDLFGYCSTTFLS